MEIQISVAFKVIVIPIPISVVALFLYPCEKSCDGCPFKASVILLPHADEPAKR